MEPSQSTFSKLILILYEFTTDSFIFSYPRRFHKEEITGDGGVENSSARRFHPEEITGGGGVEYSSAAAAYGGGARL